MLRIKSLERLVLELSKLPGIGQKTAERLAYHMLKSKDSYLQQLSQALIQVSEQVRFCKQCFNYTEQELCHFCEDPHRSGEILCVVEEPMDIIRIESSGAFRGRYHVLQGALSPLEGVGPDQLTISALMTRIQQSLINKPLAIREVIFALDADLEGDTTVLYLAKLLRDKDKEIRLTRLAHGIPVGGDIDFIDERTMGRALQNRLQLDSL
jgi:recombination protein RecR